MAIASFQFIGFALLFILIMSLSASYVWRSTILFIFSAFFLTTLIGSISAATPLLCFVFGGYGAVKTSERARSIKLGLVLVTVLVVAFTWLRRYSFLSSIPTLPFVYATVGMSYILFRVLHLIIDESQNLEPTSITLSSYLNYTCNFLSFVSGPIDRFRQFEDSMLNAATLTAQQARDAFARLIIGYAKIVIVSALIGYAFEALKPMLFGSATPSLRAIELYPLIASLYAIFLYYNFAGYIDVVISIGALAGISLPENFNRPFAATNMLDFWNRWHMTLSGWFKQYVFNPLLQFLMKAVPSASAAPWLGVFAYVFVFTLIGIWHGSTSVFLIYGCMLGLGVGLNKMWQLVLQRRLGHKRYRQLGKNSVYCYAGQGFTFAFFAVAVTAFWVDQPQLLLLSHRIGLAGLVISLCSLTVLRGLAAFFSEQLGAIASKCPSPRARWTPSFRLARMAALIISCLAVQAMLAKPAEFVYARF